MYYQVLLLYPLPQAFHWICRVVWIFHCEDIDWKREEMDWKREEMDWKGEDTDWKPEEMDWIREDIKWKHI